MNTRHIFLLKASLRSEETEKEVAQAKLSTFLDDARQLAERSGFEVFYLEEIQGQGIVEHEMLDEFE